LHLGGATWSRNSSVAQLQWVDIANRHAFQRMLRSAKARILRGIADPIEREQMKARLQGVGFHSEKCTAVRNPEFRKLPEKVRETLARTKVKTLNDVYDDVPMDELHKAVSSF
jgi:phosphotransacetylase